MLSSAYWCSICPMLSMDDSVVHLSHEERQQYYRRKRKRLTKQQAQRQSQQAHFRDKLRVDGYCRVEDDESNWSDRSVIQKMAAAAEALREHGWPATFLAMFDEVAREQPMHLTEPNQRPYS